MSPSWTCADSVGLGVQRQANRKASRTQDFAISDYMDLHSSCVSRPSKPLTVGCVTPCAPTSLQLYYEDHHVSFVNGANFTTCRTRIEMRFSTIGAGLFISMADTAVHTQSSQCLSSFVVYFIPLFAPSRLLSYPSRSLSQRFTHIFSLRNQSHLSGPQQDCVFIKHRPQQPWPTSSRANAAKVRHPSLHQARSFLSRACGIWSPRTALVSPTHARNLGGFSTLVLYSKVSSVFSRPGTLSACDTPCMLGTRTVTYSVSPTPPAKTPT